MVTVSDNFDLGKIVVHQKPKQPTILSLSYFEYLNINIVCLKSYLD
jgi:hypothetical protein